MVEGPTRVTEKGGGGGGKTEYVKSIACYLSVSKDIIK